jgi:hypothetical protein
MGWPVNLLPYGDESHGSDVHWEVLYLFIEIESSAVRSVLTTKSMSSH